MKLAICDICYSEGKLTKAKVRSKLGDRFHKIMVEQCDAHKGWLQERKAKPIADIGDELLALSLKGDNLFLG
jgi:hypothetical protein